MAAVFFYLCLFFCSSSLGKTSILSSPHRVFLSPYRTLLPVPNLLSVVILVREGPLGLQKIAGTRRKPQIGVCPLKCSPNLGVILTSLKFVSSDFEQVADVDYEAGNCLCGSLGQVKVKGHDGKIHRLTTNDTAASWRKIRSKPSRPGESFKAFFWK